MPLPALNQFQKISGIDHLFLPPRKINRLQLRECARDPHLAPFGAEWIVGCEQNLLGTSGFHTATGERPLSDFHVTLPTEVSLGEAARAYRRAEGITTILDKETR